MMRCVGLLLALCVYFTHCHLENTLSDETSDSKRHINNNQLLTSLLNDMLSRLSVAERKLTETNFRLKEAERKLADTEKKIAVYESHKRGSAVAFMGVRTTPFSRSSSSRTITYNTAKTNTAGRFSANNGRFTANQKGIYLFTFFARHESSTHSIHMYLTKNGQVVCGAAGNPNSKGMFGNTAILQLNAGDVVKVDLLRNTQIFEDGGKFVTFSGVLVTPL